MTKNNIYLPKENIAKVETIQELKNEYKVLSYEEFMKTYESNEVVNKSYDLEVDSRNNIATPYRYGPGSEQSKQAATSAGIGAGLVITTAICPPLGGALSATYAGTGLGMKVIGEIAENEDLAKAGEIVGAAGTIGTIGGGLVASSGHACVACKTPGGKEIWKLRK